MRDRLKSFQGIVDTDTCSTSSEEKLNEKDIEKSIVHKNRATSWYSLGSRKSQDKDPLDYDIDVDYGWIVVTEDDKNRLHFKHRPQLEAFLIEISDIREVLKQLSASYSKIKKFHDSLKKVVFLRSGSRDMMRTNVRELDNEVQRFRDKSSEICIKTNKMNDEIASSAPEDLSSVEHRIRRDQMNCVVSALQCLISHFNNEQIQYQNDIRKKAAILIKSPTLDREIEIANNREQSRCLIEYRGDNMYCLLEELMDRHEAVLHLESATNELHDMFHELKLQLTYHRPLLDNIEANVSTAQEFVDKSFKNVTQASHKQQAAKTTKERLLFLILVIILVILIVLYIKIRIFTMFMNTSNS